MRVIISTSVKRVRRAISKVTTLALSILFSSLLICTFLQASLNLKEYSGASFTKGEMGIRQFLNVIISGMSSVLIIVSVLSVISIFVYISMRSEENATFLSTIESIGALRSQGLSILLIEALVSYVPPMLVGSVTGAIIGNAISRSVFSSIGYEIHKTPTIFTVGTVSIVGLLLIIITTLLNVIGKAPLIERVKSHNKREADARHSYRNSYTFKKMPIEKRIAKKALNTIKHLRSSSRL